MGSRSQSLVSCEDIKRSLYPEQRSTLPLGATYISHWKEIFHQGEEVQLKEMCLEAILLWGKRYARDRNNKLEINFHIYRIGNAYTSLKIDQDSPSGVKINISGPFFNIILLFYLLNIKNVL